VYRGGGVAGAGRRRRAEDAEGQRAVAGSEQDGKREETTDVHLQSVWFEQKRYNSNKLASSNFSSI
jgi:hypothetical protein